MAKYTALYQIKLTPSNPAPPILYAFSIQADETKAGASLALKKQWYEEVKLMKKIYKNHTYFKEIFFGKNEKEKLMVDGQPISDILGGIGDDDELEIA